MSNLNIFGVDQAIAIVTTSGHSVEILNSHTYSPEEQNFLNLAEVNSIALGKIGELNGVWQKISSTNNPLNDYKKLINTSDLAEAVARIVQDLSATNSSLASTNTTINSHNSRIAVLEENIAPLQLAVTTLNQFKADELQRQSLQDVRLEQLNACCANQTTLVSNLEDAIGTINTSVGNLTDRVTIIENRLQTINDSFSVNVTGTTPVEIFNISPIDYSCIEFTYSAKYNGTSQSNYGITRGFVSVLLPNPSADNVAPAIAQEQMMKIGKTMPSLKFTTEKVGNVFKLKVAATGTTNQKIDGVIRLKIPQ